MQILVETHGRIPFIKLCDFGFCKVSVWVKRRSA